MVFSYVICLPKLQVMSIKAIGIAIKLTIEGTNQAIYFQTWIFAMVAVTCIITQLNYLNMVSNLLCIIISAGQLYILFFYNAGYLSLLYHLNFLFCTFFFEI